MGAVLVPGYLQQDELDSGSSQVVNTAALLTQLASMHRTKTRESASEV